MDYLISLFNSRKSSLHSPTNASAVPPSWGMCVKACLKSDSRFKVEAGGRARRYHLKHSAHRPQATRPNASEVNEDAGVGVFGMCWRRGAGVHVPI